MAIFTNMFNAKPVAGASGQALTVSTSVVTLFPSVAMNVSTEYVVIDCQTQNVIVTFNGETPSAGNGHLLTTTTGLIWLHKSAAAAAKFIRAGGSDGLIYVSQWSL